MARNKEGGVRTKKIIAAMAVLMMVLVAGVCVLSSAEETDAATSEIRGDTTVVKISGELTFDIIFFESDSFSVLELKYSAVLNDSNGAAQSGAVSPSSGALHNGLPTTLTVKAPATPGKYTLVVSFTEIIDDEDEIKSEKSLTITVVTPIKLSATLTNNSNVDFTDFTVYFKVDGVLVEDSKSTVSVKANAVTTVSYDWVTDSLSNGEHTFEIVAGEENIGDYRGSIIGGVGTFYVGHSDYGLVNILLGIMLVLFVILAIYFYRKQVKNYGKPKSRR
jgi:CARDB.